MFRVTFVSLVCVIVALFLLLAGCDRQTAPVSSDFRVQAFIEEAQTIEVQLGRSFSTIAGSITLRFDSLASNDFRCPQSMPCWVKGYARAAFSVEGYEHSVVLSIPGGVNADGDPRFSNVDELAGPTYIDGYELSLVSLLPHPDDFHPIPDSAYTAIVRVAPSDSVIDVQQSLMKLRRGSYWKYARFTPSSTGTVADTIEVEVVDSYTDELGTWYVLNRPFAVMERSVMVVGDTLMCRESQWMWSPYAGTDGWRERAFIPPADTPMSYFVLVGGDMAVPRMVQWADYPVNTPVGTFDSTFRYDEPWSVWFTTLNLAPGIGFVYIHDGCSKAAPNNARSRHLWLIDFGIRESPALPKAGFSVDSESGSFVP